MANKVLIGVGIGCGSLVMLGIVAVVGVGFWAKSKVAPMAESAKQMQVQQQRARELDRKYAFEEPAKGTALKLDEGRLKAYLAVREAILPVYKAMEAKSKDFDKRYKGQPQDLGTGLEAMGMLSEFLKEVRARWVDELDNQKMSPREFGAITGTVYASRLGKGMSDMQKAARPALENAIAQLEKLKANPATTPEQQKMYEQQIASMKKQLDAMPSTPTADSQVWDANAALLDRYKVQLDNDAYASLDVFLLSDEAGKGMDAAFKPLRQGQ